MSGSTSNTVTFGAFEFGVVLAAVSNGVLLLQVSRYFGKTGSDQLFLRISILLIWLVTVGHFFLAVGVLYTITITGHGIPTPATPIPVSFPALAGIGAIVHSSVQSIYTYRFYKFTGRWELPVFFWTLSAYIFASAVAYSVIETEALSRVVLFKPGRWDWIFISHFSVAAGTDILISISTCWCLINARKDAFKRTRHLTNRVMLRIVQTGIATSILSLSTAITFATFQPQAVWMALYFPLIPLYPATLLALLNGRTSIKKSSNSSTDEAIGASVISRLNFSKEVNKATASLA
ncbi:hypothetical protein BD779DRAFT_569877 [Infundibulicybe gibba]|nr:hypothetical protein BD779DRAFT_569877 [Infundibulicybe gibba]